MTTVAVLMGGTSAEREVSLRSGDAFCQALNRRGVAAVGIDYTGDLAAHRSALMRADVVVPALHGRGGEDGTVQTTLEALGIPYVGSDPRACALCMDKWRYKQRIRGHLPVPDGELVGRDSLWESALLRGAFVLKPNDGGSSIDTFVVPDPGRADRELMRDAFTRNPVMLLERLVAGTEITVGVLEERALPVVEIIPPAGGVFDYENKYNGQSRELCPPSGVPAALQQQAQEMALLAHRLCGCRDLSRTDLILDSAGDLRVLETNTFPGMTPRSLFPLAAAAAGIDVGELAVRLVRRAVNRAASLSSTVHGTVGQTVDRQ